MKGGDAPHWCVTSYAWGYNRNDGVEDRKCWRRAVIAAAVAALLCLTAAADEEGTRRSARQMGEHILKARQDVRRYVDALSEETRASQLFLVNINGKETFRPVEDVVCGGYIFFHYNVADTKQGVKAFTDSIRAWCTSHKAIPPYLAVDQEGGDVQRLRGVAPPLPSAEHVAQNMSADEAKALYTAQGKAMHDMGFHLNLAPVAEAANERNSEVLSTRSFGEEAAAAQYGMVCINAYKACGISCAIKHFPGNAAVDPHTGKSEAAIEKAALEGEIAPFIRLVHGGAEAVLMSHIRVNGLPPACLSKEWTERLRQEGFGGLIISDDIFMAAVADGYTAEDASLKAVEAGVDVIMLSEKRFGSLLDAIAKKAQEDGAFCNRVKESCFRIILFKLHHGILTMEDIR